MLYLMKFYQGNQDVIDLNTAYGGVFLLKRQKEKLVLSHQPPYSTYHPIQAIIPKIYLRLAVVAVSLIGYDLDSLGVIFNCF